MRPGIVMLVGRSGAGKSALAEALAKRLPDLRALERHAVESALFDPADDSAAERSIAFSAVLDAARYHLGRGRLAAIEVARQGEADVVRTMAADADAFVATIVWAPAEFEPADEYLTVDATGPLDQVADVAVGYIEDMAH